MLPFSLGFCLLGLFSLGEVSRGGGGGGGGGATLSLVGEIVSSNQSPKMGSLSSSAQKDNKFIWILYEWRWKVSHKTDNIQNVWSGSGVTKRQKASKLVHESHNKDCSKKWTYSDILLVKLAYRRILLSSLTIKERPFIALILPLKQVVKSWQSSCCSVSLCHPEKLKSCSTVFYAPITNILLQVACYYNGHLIYFYNRILAFQTLDKKI